MDNRSEENRKRWDGVPLIRFYAVTAVLIAAVTVMLFLSARDTIGGYTRMREATEQYITAQQDATNMQAASDYLTAQARAFVVTGDLTRAELFFEETDVTRRRDRALDEINDLVENPATYAYLSTAMDKSNELLKIECLAMRLACESYGYDPADCPARLAEAAPDEADLRLPPEEQRAKALHMLFDADYQTHKDEISENVSRSVEFILEETRSRQLGSSESLLGMIRREEILMAALLLLAAAMVLMTYFLVTRPLRESIDRIRHGEKMSEKGAAELRFLARTYNSAREENLNRHKQLSYDATHDPLTGVFNRSVFEKLRSRLKEREIALLIVDLDKFKSINDTYGHDAGDRALCRVAALLQQSFRAEDYICRIGGDEFTVIMVNANSSMRGLVEEKVTHINALLKIPEDGLPPISLSVGVAFGDREDSGGDIFKDADTALYRTKSARLGGVAFF